MTTVDKLAEQHIREHESRLAHLDELLSRAQRGAESVEPENELVQELNQLRRDRTTLENHIKDLRRKSMNEWQVAEIEQAGPMIIWDAVAKKLEKLVERLEKQVSAY